jgi:hypothetical protein
LGVIEHGGRDAVADAVGEGAAREGGRVDVEGEADFDPLAVAAAVDTRSATVPTACSVLLGAQLGVLGFKRLCSAAQGADRLVSASITCAWRRQVASPSALRRSVRR